MTILADAAAAAVAFLFLFATCPSRGKPFCAFSCSAIVDNRGRNTKPPCIVCISSWDENGFPADDDTQSIVRNNEFGNAAAETDHH